MDSEALAPIGIISPEQKQDIGSSQGPSMIHDRCFRLKQYVKDREREYLCTPRDLEFDQPYQLASHLTGKTWDECDRVFLGQVMGCNLECEYCFLSRKNCKGALSLPSAHDGGVLSGYDSTPVDIQVFEDISESANIHVDRTYFAYEQAVWMSAKSYVRAFTEYNQRVDVTSSSYVLRVSGGEPFLYDDWLADVCVQWAVFDGANRRGLLWVDTNGTIEPSSYLSFVLAHKNIAVCLCFKPHGEGGRERIHNQLGVARTLVDAGVNVFFYWPSYLHPKMRLAKFLPLFHSTFLYGPLRLNVLRIHNYETMKQRMHQYSDGLLALCYAAEMLELKEFCNSTYSTAECWMPSHLVSQTLK